MAVHQAKSAVWLGACLVLGACSHRREATCPPLEELARRDPKADANAAADRGDTRLVMLGGFVGELPGGLGPGQVRTLEGTSDTTTRACVKMRPLALRYARIYNRVILKRQLRPISSADKSGPVEDNSAR